MSVGGSANIEIDNDNDTINGPSNGTISHTFYLLNSGTGGATVYYYLTSVTGPLSGCSLSSSQAYMPANGEGNVTVSCSTGLTGTGSVTMRANWGSGLNANGSVTVVLPAVEQAVTTAAPAGPVHDDVSSSYIRAFTVHNPNATGETYTWNAVCATAVSCSGQNGSIPVPANSTVSQNVTYTTSATPGSGTVTFTASDAAGSSNAVLSVVLNNYQPGVAPSSEFGPLVIGPQVVDTFTVSNDGNSTATYNLLVSCDGSIPPASCSLVDHFQSSVYLTPNSTELVPVRWTASGSGTTSHVSLTASYGTFTATGTKTLTYYPWVAPSVTAQGIPPGGFNEGDIGLIQSFTVTNHGSSLATYNYDVSCADDVGEADVSPKAVPIVMLAQWL